ncbi:serine/threonine protein kinase [Cladophialophora yegresii CBS 114405]|uniref:Serine/threonine protein kinase n=1 Tax=Cladophialophora yegresii CBS 114405 TaxID=1182544 RepID=W9WBL3_9EURO|nr:serine/threonine protein kinase [Cladophialophora yegresii CBS 114405]EXJ55924.1 serine/threonine protein kinase [Cladophialophora yegresii CBS 114405]
MSGSNAAPQLSHSIGDRVHDDQFHHSGSSSEDEYNRKIEVVFDTEGARRRKSSTVLLETPTLERPKRSTPGRSMSQCLVHKLVEKSSLGQQPKVESQLEQIDEVEPEAKSGRVDGDSSKDLVRTTQSRLLTKKQLSDMAISVRTLAKRLGNLKVKLKVRAIFLLTKIYDKTLIVKTREVTRWLLSKDRSVPYIVYVEDNLKDNPIFDAEGLVAEDPSIGDRLKYWDTELARRHPHTFDFVVTLGGDGTVLYASWLFQRVVPPVLSFALGSLGFLTKFDFENYQHILSQALKDGISISLRLRFEGTVMRSHKRDDDAEHRDIVEELIGEEADDRNTHKPDRTFEILNDIVVDRGPNPTMSTIELFGDEEHLTTVQADGICVATPTGSTAYNLAAGGSLCHPENPVILVTAICAHTLSFRPIILPDTIVLRLGVPYDARSNSWASFDGRERIELFPGDYVTISASRYPFANVMPPGRRSEDWVNSISRTLQWNSRQRQKAFHEWEEKAIQDDRQINKKEAD